MATALQAPRTTRGPIRRAAIYLHLYLGVGLGLYLALMSITGSALVFADELERWLRPELFRSASNAQTVGVDALSDAARAAYPERTVTAIYAPSHGQETYTVYLRKGEEILYAYVDSGGSVRGGTTPSTSVVRCLREFHFNLLSGKTGRTVQGYGGAVLFFLAVTGLIAWWPAAGKLAGRLMLRWRGGAWSAHASFGFWVAPVIAMWGLTGFYFGHSATVNTILHRVSPLQQQSAPVSRSGPSQVTSLESMLSQSVARTPGGHLYGVQYPASATAPYIVFVSRIPDGEKRHCDYHYFDRVSGEYLSTWRRGVPNSWGEALVATAVPLHFGSFGGFPLKVLWSILGLTPTLLAATGCSCGGGERD